MKTLESLTRLRLAAAVGGSLALAISAAPAGASVYGGSILILEDLEIIVVDDTPPAVTSFDFNGENGANLFGVSAPAETDACGGTIGSNDCGGPGLRLDPLQAFAPGASVAAPAQNSFSFIGPSITPEQYARADSLVPVATLTDGANTEADWVAEAELADPSVSVGTAAAGAELGSNTSFNITFNAGAAGELTVTFDAQPQLAVEISSDAAIPAFARASTDVEFTLTEELTGNTVSWAPNGNLNPADCQVTIVGVTCEETADDSNLNRNLAVSSAGGSNSFAPAIGDFGFRIRGLSSGEVYTLALTGTAEVSLRQDIPAPGVLLLLSGGLLGLALTHRRRRLS